MNMIDNKTKEELSIFYKEGYKTGYMTAILNVKHIKHELGDIVRTDKEKELFEFIIFSLVDMYETNPVINGISKEEIK